MKKKIALILFLYSSQIFSQNENKPFSIQVANIKEQGKYQQMVTDAISLLTEVLNTEEFKQKVEAKEYDWLDLGGGTYYNLTGKQIFDILYIQEKKIIMNLYIKPRGFRLGARLSGTLGITTILSNSTKTYDYWLDLSSENYQQTIVEYASHIAHEYCHQKGFYDKDYSQTEFRNVVPYAIGDIVCELLNKKLKTNFNCNK